MLYWKYSSTHTYFLNEYWIFVPSALLANYIFIRKIYSNKKKKRENIEQLRKLTKQIERQKRLKKILFLSLGLNSYGYIHLITRGGSSINFIDVVDSDYIRDLCTIDEGIRFLDDARLRNIIKDLYSHKHKGKIIYITATALCHLFHRYGSTFLALPFAIGDFGLTNAYQTARKGIVTILLATVGPLIINGNPVALFFALIFGMSGLRIAFTDLDFIPTSAVDVEQELKPRIPNMYDVVVVNNRNKITMHEPLEQKPECWLPGQPLLNSNCELKPTQIPDGIDLALPNLKYENTVNMPDVTGLDRIEFTDKFDIGQIKSTISNSQRGKEVNFLDKFGSGPVSEAEQWDIHENGIIVPEKKNLIKTGNKS